MTSMAKIMGGRKAHANGKMFEELFTYRARVTGFTCTQIPAGCRVLGPGRIQRIRTHFDFVLSGHGKTFLIDTKTVDAETFPHSSIQDHQAVELSRHSIHGTVAGYVIYLRKKNEVIFVPAIHLVTRMRFPGSISPDDSDVVRLGTCEGFDLIRVLTK